MTESDITLEKVFEIPDAEISDILDVSAVLTAAYLFSIVIRGCFPGENGPIGPACEAGWRMLLPMGIYSALIVTLGVFSGGIIGYLTDLARTLM